MEQISELIAQIKLRLPELHFKLKKTGSIIPFEQMPEGLFNIPNNNVENYIEYILVNLEGIEHIIEDSAKLYKINKIAKMIRCLVHYCKVNEKNKFSQKLYDLDSIKTRQQWLSDLKIEITGLQEQKVVLEEKINQIDLKTEVILALKKELGELNQQLSLLCEIFDKAVS